jgi:hypothetical protein
MMHRYQEVDNFDKAKEAYRESYEKYQMQFVGEA